MKQKDHLPFFGIGPYYVGTIAVLTAVGIAKLQTPGHLIAVIVLTAAMAVLAIWLCGKVDKKSVQLLK